LALDVSGHVWAWGVSAYGQLGPNAASDTETPVDVGLSRIVDIAAGNDHNLAVDLDGNVWAWGINSFGELGLGVQGDWTEPNPTPRQVPGLPRISRVGAGGLHSIALAENGDVYGWGYNTSGQVGDGSVLPANTGRLSPVKLAIANVAQISAGGSHNLVLTSDGALWAWGSDLFGALGNNSKHDLRVPTRIDRLHNVSAIAAGGNHSLAMAPARPTWSAYVSSQTGASKPAFSPVAGLSNVVWLAAGARHSLAVTADHRVWAWGDNTFKQLGFTGPDATAPVEVIIPLDPGQGIVAVAAGSAHSVALRSDGSVWTWGDGSRGQLGVNAVQSATPQRVPLPGPVAWIAAHGPNNAVSVSNGAVLAWGDNTLGQLGLDVTVSKSSAPVAIDGILRATSVALGWGHGVALEERGGIYAWGDSSRAQLGTNCLGATARAVRVNGIDDATAIAAGPFSSFATTGSRVLAWGDPDSGALGTGTGFNYWVPRPILGLTRADSIAAGPNAIAGIDDSLTLWLWGNQAEDCCIPHGAGVAALAALGESHVLVAR
jgi:alpha-tubulin suppressor-like RCC1 family protein